MRVEYKLNDRFTIDFNGAIGFGTYGKIYKIENMKDMVVKLSEDMETIKTEINSIRKINKAQ